MPQIEAVLFELNAVGHIQLFTVVVSGEGLHLLKIETFELSGFIDEQLLFLLDAENFRAAVFPLFKLKD